MNLNQVIKHKFFKSSIIVFAANAVSSILNYLYHLITVRHVTVSEYGTIQSLISLNYLFSILSGALSLTLISKLGDKNEKEISSYTIPLTKIALKGSLSIWLILLIFYPLIRGFLHLKSFSPFFVFSFQHAIIFLPVLFQSILNSQLKFWQSSLAGVLATGSKILTIIFLFGLGLSINGALFGWVSFKIILLLISGFFVYYSFKPFKRSENQKLNLNFWRFSLISLVVNFALTIIYTFDILLVKHFFNQTQAGIYAATSTIGKIIFFAASSILLVAYPLFSRYKNKLKKLKKLLIISFLSCLIIIAGGLVIYKFLGQLLINKLLTHNYLDVLPYLFQFGLFASLASVFNLIIRFFLAVESKLSMFISIPTALGQVILILIRHQDLFEVINNSIIMLTIGSLIGLFFIFKYFTDEAETKKV